MKNKSKPRMLKLCAIMSIACMFFSWRCGKADPQNQSLNNELRASNAAIEQNKTKTAGTKVTFVELGSENCMPCRMMQPIVREIKEQYKTQVRVVYYDVWTEQGSPYARMFGIRLIPTQVFLDSDGKEFFRHEGFFSKEDIVAVLKTKGVQ